MKNEINNKKVVLLVLDGWGLREDYAHQDNAVFHARTPNFDNLYEMFPHTKLEASGLAVGLPVDQVGNSEIGHTTIGAGIAIPTDLVRITKDAILCEFLNNESFNVLWNHVNNNESRLHIMGLLSDGGVHSHIRHLIEFIKNSKGKTNQKIILHLFSDGRDVNRDKLNVYVKEVLELCDDQVIVGSIIGRYYAMDRDNNTDRLAKFWDMIHDKDFVIDTDLHSHVKYNYENNIFDEHLTGIKFANDIHVDNNDGVFVFNFRADRARMVVSKLCEVKTERNLCIVGLTEYKADFPILTAYKPLAIETTLAREISIAGKTQSHIAETEKFPHATYYLNGGVEEPYEGEEHILIPSRKDIKTHDMAPEMRAIEIATKACEEIKKGKDFLFINIANPDVVGHTANFEALVTAIETTDTALGIIYNAVNEAGYILIATADHGNAERNLDVNGDLHTSHTMALVPCIITNKEYVLCYAGTLADLAPTVLHLMGIEKPKSMTGESLIIS